MPVAGQRKVEKVHAMEEWRDIAGYEGCYQVSSCGRVKSLERPIYRADGSLHRMQSEKILADRVNTYGYHLVLLSNMGATETKCIHRLVAEAFIPNDDGRPQVNHIDGNKANNAVENLEWCTGRENILHARDVLGRKLSGRRKLTNDDVRHIRESAEPYTALSKRYGVCLDTIGAVRQRRTHRSVV